MTPGPRFSVLTACLNRAEFLPACIESLQNQTYKDWEHIVVDGGSTDGSVELLRDNPGIRLVTEPDEGMYDALNKALYMAQGEIICFLNSDDLLAAGALGQAARRFDDHPELDAVCGSAELFIDTNEGSKTIRMLSARFNLLARTSMNAWFFRREALLRLGGFDSRLRVFADRLLLIRFMTSNPRVRMIPQVTCRYRRHPGSMTFSDAGIPDDVAEEAIRTCRTVITEHSSSRRIKVECKNWHAQSVGGSALGALRAGNLASMSSWLFVGFDRDLWWPIRFARHLLFVKLLVKRFADSYNGPGHSAG
jgi:glycosyltransferase involved in cell wall biosynthesis